MSNDKLIHKKYDPNKHKQPYTLGCLEKEKPKNQEKKKKLSRAYITKPTSIAEIVAIHLIYKPSKLVNDNIFEHPVITHN